MATTSSTSSIVTTLGAGSGIDMADLAADLAEAQFRNRSNQLTTRSSAVERQVSAASSLRNAITTLASSFGARVRTGDLSSQPQIANGSIAKVTATGATPVSGSYALEVLSLARGQSLAGPAMASASTSVGSGSLTIRFGSLSAGTGSQPGSFAADAGRAPITVEIAKGATLAEVARAISASGSASGSGVSAYVATGTGGATLMVKGPTGAASGFVIEASEATDDPGLAALAWEPATGDPDRLGTVAGNAILKVDGIALTSAGNTLSNAIPGASLALTGTNAGAPTHISFTDPADAIGTAMQDLTEALNEVAAQLSDATDPVKGDLARDPGARALRSALSALAGRVVMPNATGSAPRTLADLGLATERKGGFRLDTARLSDSLARNPSAVAAMFTNGLDGVFATLDGIARSTASSGNPGSLAGSIARYSGLQTTLGKQSAKLADDQEALRARLSSRFAVADRQVGSSRSTLSFLQSQIDSWNASAK